MAKVNVWARPIPDDVRARIHLDLETDDKSAKYVFDLVYLDDFSEGVSLDEAQRLISTYMGQEGKPPKLPFPWPDAAKARPLSKQLLSTCAAIFAMQDMPAAERYTAEELVIMARTDTKEFNQLVNAAFEEPKKGDEGKDEGDTQG